MQSAAEPSSTVELPRRGAKSRLGADRLRLHDFDPVLLLGIFVSTNVAVAFFFHSTPVHTIFLWVTALYGVVALYLALVGIPLPKVSTS